MEKNRILYLDVIKIVACFWVIVNHTTGTIFLSREPSLTWFGGIVYFFVSKPAVPLFLMASGAILLGRQESYSRTKDRIIRMVSILLIYSFCYTFLFNKTLPLNFDGFLQFIPQVISINQTNTLWYMYLYIGILVMLPILQKMVGTFEKKDYYYFMGISIFLLGSIPLINHFYPIFNVSNHFKNVIFSTYIGLYISGYFLHKFVTPTKKGMILSCIMYILLLVLQVIGIYSEYDTLGNDAYRFYDNRVMILITSSSLILFYISKYIFTEYTLSEKIAKIITYISSCTFGIYLISDFYIGKFWFIFNDLSTRVNPIFAVIIFQLVVFGMGFITTIILKKIPYFRKSL